MNDPQPSRLTSRRRFITSATSSLAVAGLAPMILHAQDKSGSKQPRVGEGQFTYECLHDWGADSLPAGHHYGNASHGITIDRQGLVYITHHGSPGSIFVFDADGRFVRALGETIVSGGSGKGHGIDIRLEGNEEFLYLSPNDSALEFVKMNLRGEIVWTRGKRQLNADSHLWDADSKLGYRPTNASFRPDGGYYLGDGYGSGYIFEYDQLDKFVRAIGGQGAVDGKFKTPHGQWLDDRDGQAKLVVADRANKRLQWFDMQGQHLRTQDGFLFPAAIDARKDLLLVPDLHARVTLLGLDNQVVAQLGDDVAWRERVLAGNNALRSQRSQWQPGKFVHPHDACFDSQGNIFVVEWVVTGRVTKLVKVG